MVYIYQQTGLFADIYLLGVLILDILGLTLFTLIFNLSKIFCNIKLTDYYIYSEIRT
jgi:hypothetical protein